MMYSPEKIRQLNWGFIEKRFAENTVISPSFKEELRNLFLDLKDFDEKGFESFSLEEVFVYLKVSHKAYLDVSLPKIENTLHQLCLKHGAKNISLNLLLVFIEKYKTQLVNHIKHEEQVLFRFVENLFQGEYSTRHKNFVMTHFLHTHNDNIILSLDELKKDLITFDAGLQSNLAFSVLFEQLTCFQHDLMIHGLIEDHVFIKKILGHINTHFEPVSVPGNATF